jgi:hypothetical protein
MEKTLENHQDNRNQKISLLGSVDAAADDHHYSDLSVRVLSSIEWVSFVRVSISDRDCFHLSIRWLYFIWPSMYSNWDFSLLVLVGRIESLSRPWFYARKIPNLLVRINWFWVGYIITDICSTAIELRFICCFWVIRS